MDKLLILLALSASWVPSEAACPASCQSCSNERVHCAGAALTQLPEPLHEDTMTIDMSQNGIQTLKNLPDLPKVESFRISMNKIDVLTDNTFAKMPLLMSLDLSMNEISRIRKNAFKGLIQLQSLSLNGNKLTAIRSIFANTPKVQSLRLGNNEITSIEEENFKENTMIRQLDLSNNKISSIHEDAFKSLKMLRYLILSNNPLGTLPEMTIGGNMLSLADFTNCALTKVPRRMPSSLKDFRLSNNMITEIMVEDFENITSLSLLILNNNKIQNVEHRSFWGLKQLQELWLTDNRLVYIPRGLPKSLQKLHMERNQLVELETMLFQEGSKLRELSLESNNINKVHPDALKEVKKLETIVLQGNKIARIDAGTFKDLPKLKVIKFTDNPIQYFEKGAFDKLDALTDLHMSYVDHQNSGTSQLLGENFLTSMPNLSTLDLMSSIHVAKEILEVMSAGGFVMEQLETINLQYNDLTTLPDGIAKALPNVKKFYLDGNNFVCNSNLRWLKRWMKSSDIIFKTYEDIKCNKPEAVKGLAIRDVADDVFVDIAEKNTGTATANEVEPVPDRTENTEARPNNAQRNNGRDNTNTQPKTDDPKPDSNTEAARRPQNPPSQTSYGTRVVIKPRKGADKAMEEEKKKKTAESRSAAKARRKAMREARRRKKEEAKRLRRNRRHKNKKDSSRNKRNKRRIKRNHCQTDAEGNVTCKKRRRCKVNGENGNVQCPKREKKDKKDRGRKKKKEQEKTN